MAPGVRKLALTAHVTASVGWLGTVACFLGLSVAALVSEDAQTVRGAYVVMEAIGWFVLVPFAIASLVTGLVQSLGTRWGLLRHYWVLAKLIINAFATIVLLMYMETLSVLGDAARATTGSGEDPSVLSSPSPLIHAAAALVLLLVATVLAVYKPQGLTRYGQRRQLLSSGHDVSLRLPGE